MKIVYGILTPSEIDGETLLELNGLLPPRSPRVNRQQLVEIVSQTTVFVARDAEKTHLRGAFKIVGMALLSAKRLMSGFKGGLDDVSVSKFYRGNGIRRGLMKAAIAHARKMKMKHLKITVNTSNPEREHVIEIYRSLGFEPQEDTRTLRLRFAPDLANP